MIHSAADETGKGPLVSVVMTFLNAEKFIQEAIDSVLAQTFRSWELLLVDDGSDKPCTNIALQYAARYPGQAFYLEHPSHQNRGISASRNLGVRHAKGKYIAFLDADDLWLPCKLAQQVAILESQPSAEMVYGFTEYWYGWTGGAEDRARDYVPDLGIQPGLFAPPSLVELVYPLGQATAPSMSDLLVRRELVEKIGGFEEDFRGMYEDQAFLVKAYLHATVYVSGECWDKYRIHPDSCLSVSTQAGEYQKVRLAFLEWFDSYLVRQGNHDPQIWSALQKAYETRRSPQEVLHYRGWLFRVAGESVARLIVDQDQPESVRVVIDKNVAASSSDIQLNLPRLKVQSNHSYRVCFRAKSDVPRSLNVGVALAHEPWGGLGFYRTIDLTQEWQSFDETFVANADEGNARIHFDMGESDVPLNLAAVSLRLSDGNLAPGDMNFGTLRRVTPVSRMWGYDRGLPVDRHYIENYLLRHSADIRGRVMEIEDDTYTRRFGGNNVTRCDVLHVVAGNPRATIIGDLTDAPQIPSGLFDCIVLTQTLQLIYEVRAAIQTLHRILRPGGVLLVTFTWNQPEQRS